MIANSDGGCRQETTLGLDITDSGNPGTEKTTKGHSIIAYPKIRGLHIGISQHMIAPARNESIKV